MTRTVVLAGYAAVAAAMVALQAAALATGRLPTLGAAVAAAARRRPVRWLLLAGWLWVGWHVFSRAEV